MKLHSSDRSGHDTSSDPALMLRKMLPLWCTNRHRTRPESSKNLRANVYDSTTYLRLQEPQQATESQQKSPGHSAKRERTTWPGRPRRPCLPFLDFAICRQPPTLDTSSILWTQPRLKLWAAAKLASKASQALGRSSAKPRTERYKRNTNSCTNAWIDLLTVSGSGTAETNSF